MAKLLPYCVGGVLRIQRDGAKTKYQKEKKLTVVGIDGSDGLSGFIYRNIEMIVNHERGFE